MVMFAPLQSHMKRREGAVHGGHIQRHNFRQFNSSMWNDFFNRYQPVQNALMGGNNMAERVADASADAQTAFDITEGTLGRQQAGLNLELSEVQKEAQRKKLGLARTLADVDARNRTRLAIGDEDRFRGDAALKFGQGYNSLAGSALSGAAASETQRDNEITVARARHKAGLMGLAGQVIGMATGSMFKQKPGTG